MRPRILAGRVTLQPPARGTLKLTPHHPTFPYPSPSPPTQWLTFLAADKSVRSNTSICLQLDLPKEKVKTLTALLESEGVAFDIGSYRDAPPGLRLWGGATVEPEDMAILMQWIKWAFHTVAAQK